MSKKLKNHGYEGDCLMMRSDSLKVEKERRMIKRDMTRIKRITTEKESREKEN